MKRLVISALFLTLAAGSVAMAGQGHPAGAFTRSDNSHDSRGKRDGDHRGGDRHDNRGHSDNNHGNRNDHNNNQRRNDRRDDHRRNDWNGGRSQDGRRDDHRFDGRRDDHRFDGRRDDWRNDHRNDNRNYGRRDDHRRNDWNDHRNDRRSDWNRHDNYRYNSWSRPRYSAGVYYRPSGWYDHRWSRGERLPRGYYARPYVIGNYYDCGLRSPPYGYHWVRVDGNAVLAAVATGVILDVIYNQFY